LADTTFDGDVASTLVVSFTMLVGFWTANELMVKDSRVFRIVGYLVWFVVILFLPAAIMIDRKWSIPDLFAQLGTLSLAFKLFLGVAAITMCTLPALPVFRKEA
jgi:hypothetical protein